MTLATPALGQHRPHADACDEDQVGRTPPPQPLRRIRVGTSGWSYAHWGLFSPAGLADSAMLGHYAQHFGTVEINSSFYRLPQEAALERWADTVPAGFVFSVKASRYITHMKKLRDPAATLAPFLERIGRLGHRLGPVLFQLPPRWRCDLDRLRSFLEALPGHLGIEEGNRERMEMVLDRFYHISEVAG